MPAFLGHELGVLVSHRASLRSGKFGSSGGRTMSILRSSRRCLCAGQMRDAIFLAIARDAKLEIGIAQLRRPTNRAFVNRFLVAPRLTFNTLATRRNLPAMP